MTTSSNINSPMHSWYLKYDNHLSTNTKFIENINKIIESLHIEISFQTNSDIISLQNHPFPLQKETLHSSNRFDSQVQILIAKILEHFLEFFKNEVFCNDTEIYSIKAFNFIYIESFYCSFFWKAAINKPIPEFLRDRLFCTLFRIEDFLFELHEFCGIKENPVFCQILKVLAYKIKALIISLEELISQYTENFYYLVRLLKLFQSFPFFDDNEKLEEFLSESLPLDKREKMVQGVLAKSHQKKIFRKCQYSYNLLMEDCMQGINNPRNYESETLIQNKASSSHSLNSRNLPKETPDSSPLVNKPLSKTVGKLQTIENKKKSVRAMTLEDNLAEDDEYAFINHLANSYFTTQIMSTKETVGSSYQKLINPTPETQGELSIIASKMLLKSKNLPFNSYFGKALPETTINEALISKIISGIKSLRRKKRGKSDKQDVNELKSDETKEIYQRKRNLLRISPLDLQHFSIKEKNEVDEKLSNNLYKILTSKDPNQLRDNILIAKNKNNVKKNENLETNDFFEQKRKDRINFSQRESAAVISITSEESPTRNKTNVIRFDESKGIDEKNKKESDKKDKSLNKTMEVVGIKEKDFIKISKKTEIMEKLKASLFHEKSLNEPYDEDIIDESSNESETKINLNNRFTRMKNFFKEFIGEVADFKEAGFGFDRTKRNTVDLFQSKNTLSARRKGMHDEVVQGLLRIDPGNIMGETKFGCFFKRDKYYRISETKKMFNVWDNQAF